MKKLFNLVVLTFLFLAASSRCFALMEIADVSKPRAKELGITIRSNSAGPNAVQVWLELKTTGELASFSHVELEITDGGKRLVTARLLAERPRPATVTASFTADPAYLDKSTLMVVAQPSPRTRIGYRLKLKDFIEPEKPR